MSCMMRYVLVCCSATLEAYWISGQLARAKEEQDQIYADQKKAGKKSKVFIKYLAPFLTNRPCRAKAKAKAKQRRTSRIWLLKIRWRWTSMLQPLISKGLIPMNLLPRKLLQKGNLLLLRKKLLPKVEARKRQSW